RAVELRSDLIFQTVTLHVGRYADDGPCALSRMPEQDAFAERVFAGEVTASYSLVDDCDRRRRFVVQFGEGASGSQLHAHYAKVIVTDFVCFHEGFPRIVDGRTAFNCQRLATGYSSQGKPRADRRSLRSGQSFKAREQFPDVGFLLWRAG